MNVKKIANINFCFAILLGINSLEGKQHNILPPISSIHKEISKDECGKNNKTDLVERPVIPSFFVTYSRIDRDTTYTFDLDTGYTNISSYVSEYCQMTPTDTSLCMCNLLLNHMKCLNSHLGQTCVHFLFDAQNYIY